MKINSMHGWTEAKKRGVLEKSLREVVFHHKEEFPDLKASALVKRWENETGQQW
jgi:hypothetical protein